MSYYENRIKALEERVEEMAQRERLKAIPVEKNLIDRIVELKAEVERLRKAGDAVCESPYLWENDPAVIAWRAAKEGKPSV